MRRGWLGGVAWLSVFISFQAIGAPQASKPMGGVDMRDWKCTINAALAEDSREQSKSVVRVLYHQFAVMAKFDKLMKSRSWKHDVAVGKQMTPAEANQFGNLEEQTKIGLMSSMLESKRARDLRVFGKMVEMAKRMQGDFEFPSDTKSDAFALVGFLLVGREKFQLSTRDEVDLMVTSQGTCTLQNSLIAEAKRTLDSLDSMPGIPSAGHFYEALGAKYGKPIDRAKLDQNEVSAYDRNAALMRTAISRQTYFEDLLFIARLEAVSKLQRDTRRTSRYEAPGDNDHINTVWNAWVKEGKITAEQDSLSRVLNYINEKFPSDM